MSKLLRIIPIVIACFCTATLMAQLILGAVAWSRGNLSRDRVVRVLAAAYGIEAASAEDELDAEGGTRDEEQPAYEAIQEAQLKASLDRDLREAAVAKGVDDFRSLEKKLQTDLDRYRLLKDSFANLLAGLEGQKLDDATQDVQYTLENMMPKQAKDQILKMLDDGDMQHVVTIIKAMPLDKRKKILGEFKINDEPEKLHEILKEIQTGAPEVTLIRDTRKQLEQL